ncbi:MAG: histidine phosphatase family protein [Flavobacteriales bacterium]|jgi:2,3-bisphosphoglycerate-dependent phosphoglycerate mutase|nr:histidine phosphatase family protein [Flavobacteriales bacterium]
MKRLSLFMLLIGLNFPAFSQDSTAVTTTYFLIRHAEKDRSNPENKNPHLNDIGFKRALKWSQVFKDVKLDAVYTTNYNRTIETANPTAASHHLKVSKYHPVNIDYKDFIFKTKGKTVLIVGHSNTIPNFVNALIGTEKYNQIADTNNANLYIVTLIGGEISDIQLYIK